jgi:predicted nucleic acid-binding protein
MPKIVISDSSILIIFHKIKEFSILQKVYGELITTPEIMDEFGENIPDWIKIHSVKDRKYQEFLETQVDVGEASAIALAAEYDEVLLLLDDLKARKLATSLKLKVTGKLGIISKAKQLLIIEQVKPMIDKLLITDFRLSDDIVEEFMKLNNE